MSCMPSAVEVEEGQDGIIRISQQYDCLLKFGVCISAMLVGLYDYNRAVCNVLTKKTSSFE